MVKRLIMTILLWVGLTFSMSLAAAPSIVISEWPEYGQNGSIRGTVTGVSFADYRVAPYIYIDGSGWWTKPTFASPTVEIAGDGTFAALVTTGGLDPYAVIYCAAVIPSDVTPPYAGGARRVPAALNTVTLSINCKERDDQTTVSFAGYNWAIKEAPLPVGPGSNRFSADPENVRVDSQGKLHLKITYQNGSWRAAEVILLESFGYGTYLFQTEHVVDGLDANATFGAFTWDPYGDENRVPTPNTAGDNREIDAEDSRWTDENDTNNTQWVVQPYSVHGNKVRFTIPDSGTNPTVTRCITWLPGEIKFVARRGAHATCDGSDVIHQHTYQADPDLKHFVPSNGGERFRFNLWLNNVEVNESDKPPRPAGDGAQGLEAIVSYFAFLPAPSTYSDVSSNHPAYIYAEGLAMDRIATGCGNNRFCPDQVANRELLATWLLRAKHRDSVNYMPPPATGGVFGDIGANEFAASFIEDLFTPQHQITEGCDASRYCPKQVVDKTQAAVMLLKAKHGPGFVPPTATSSPFTDVDIGDPGIFGDGDFAADWIVEFHNQSFARRCYANNYCPKDILTKAGLSRLTAEVFNIVP